MKFLTDIELQGNELTGVKIENLAADPAAGYSGRLYFNTTTNRLREHNGTEWANLSRDVPVFPNTETEAGEGIYNLNGTTTNFNLAPATGSGRKVIVNLNTLPPEAGDNDAYVGAIDEAVTGTYFKQSDSWGNLETNIDLGIVGTTWYVSSLYLMPADSGSGVNPPTYDIRLLEDGEVLWTESGYPADDGDVYPNDVYLTSGNTYSVQVRVHTANPARGITFKRGAAGDIGLGTGDTEEIQLEFELYEDTYVPDVNIKGDTTDTVNGTSLIGVSNLSTVMLVDSATGKWTATPYKTSYTASDIGLGKVSNTSDSDKPVSIATQTEVDRLDSRIDSVSIAAGQHPDYVRKYANFASLPGTPTDTESGTEGRLWYTVDDNKLYRYNGASYVEVAGRTGYTETFTASTTWTINHNLGYIPSVVTMNASGVVIIGQVSHPSVNQTIVEYNSAVAGDVACE